MSYHALFVLAAALGTILSTNAAVLIPLNAPWEYQKGLAEGSLPDPRVWRHLDFANSWPAAPAPFWYGDAQPSAGTLLDDMRGNYTSLFSCDTRSASRMSTTSEGCAWKF